ncbi:uncharacterized protein B0P05DRAFT_536941, partial [Gilbertella persicaria]|uniref:uncharacterized protein n=1 Tax=Gilbertella persicaria TaxID=101096 RepID=UPI0022210345
MQEVVNKPVEMHVSSNQFTRNDIIYFDIYIYMDFEPLKKLDEMKAIKPEVVADQCRSKRVHINHNDKKKQLFS